MSQYGVMDGFEFRKAQAQYKRATDDVLGWLREITNTPKERASVSFHKILASNAKAAGIAMPQNIQAALDAAISLRTQCKHHHIMLGSNDQGHNFILGELQQIQKIYELEPTECPPVPEYAPAPPEQFTAPTFTSPPPSPDPPFIPVDFNGAPMPDPMYTGSYQLAPDPSLAAIHNAMYNGMYYDMQEQIYYGMQENVYPGMYQSIYYDNTYTLPVYQPVTLQQTYQQVADCANGAAAFIQSQHAASSIVA